ncbi:toxic anion resistance protein [Globicatella sanguinis]|uniref:toxic anion resistance protein n=1 Tax=Globicatella sanguinis TaxID=13076 RepID=UPI002542D0C3|nr:toxic anion resistance protein [Globicatella sanguinis]MDK7630337.1 toxic anion resistance protein [Globicatella sanguinis]WIK67381.1 toxic anion resistance protein [Globicatella sanguinis]WKT56786.1 toxic anion resistance protein [Globicatella sanguinis]
MTKISLDELMSQAQVDKANTEIAENLEEKFEVLDEASRKKVDSIKEKINLRDSQLSSMFGANAQKSLAGFSETILSQVRAHDLGEVGNLMTDLVVNVQNFDADFDNKGLLAKIPFINKAKKSIEKYLARYDIVEKQIDKIEAKLETSRMEMLKDISMYDKLYDENLKYFEELQLYIVAGEEVVKDMRDNQLPALLKEAEAKEDSMALQVVNDFKESIDRFEKRIFDLKTSKTLAIQTAPQIKLIQNNDKLLVDKVTDAINNVIPLWKSQVVIALGMEKQKRVLELERQVSDTANELLRKNADKLRQNSVEIAEEAERSIVDIDTVKHVNQQLIETIRETMAIHENAKTARIEAEKELITVENELKTAIAETIYQDTRSERRDVTPQA